MRRQAVLAATTALAFLAVSVGFPVVLGQTAVRISWDVQATSVGGNFRFILGRVLGRETPVAVGEVPTEINVTVVNNDPIAGTFHTFTILGTDGDAIVDVPLPHGTTATVTFLLWKPADAVEFWVNASGDNRTAETEGGLLFFFCRPHRELGMVGRVAVGGVEEEAEPQEKGVFLRAYWIGLLGIAGTLLLVGVSYFVIKGGSRHYRDHREHIRRGLP